MATLTPKFSREIRFRWYYLVGRQGLTVAAVYRLYDVAQKTYYPTRAITAAVIPGTVFPHSTQL